MFEWKCAIKASVSSLSPHITHNLLIVLPVLCVYQSKSPYKGGTFNFTLTLPENFPFKPPSVCQPYPVLSMRMQRLSAGDALILCDGGIRSPLLLRSTTPESTRRATSVCLSCEIK